MRKDWLWIVLILLIGGVLYAAGLDYGLPLPQYNPSTVQNGWLNESTVFHPDAYDYASRPYSMLLRHISPVKPNFYHNPSLTIEINMLMSWLSNATSIYHGPFDPTAKLPEGTVLNCEIGAPPNPVCLRQIAPFSVYVVARYLSALMTLLMVSIVYITGHLIFSKQVGLVAALLVAFCPMVVQIAHYENPGATTLAISSAALCLSLILIKRPSASWKFYAGAGLFVGLSAAARYNAVVVGIVFLLACILSWWGRRKFKPIFIGFIAIPIGFVIGTPGSIFEIHKFIEDATYIIFWYSTLGGGPGWTTSGVSQSLAIYWRYIILIVIGPLAALAGLFGLASLLRRFRFKDLSFWAGVGLLLYVVVYSFAALSSKRLNANLIIPLITPLALLAAYGLSHLPALFQRRRSVILILAVVLLAWPVFLSFFLAGMFLAPDSRMLAQAWIEANIPHNTPIHLLGSYNVPLDPLDYPTVETEGAQAPLDDPLWNSPIIVYSDSYPLTVLRDPSLTENPADVENTRAILQRLQSQWIELARFKRTDWPGENLPPDDVSFWHQMEIVVYCNPTNCPVKHGE